MVGPKRGTKAYKEEPIAIVYGINPRTKKVQSVYVGRDRVLSSMNDAGDYVRHYIKPGWTAENEARLIFGLREIFSVPIGVSDSDYTKKRIEELKAKAADWKEEG